MNRVAILLSSLLIGFQQSYALTLGSANRSKWSWLADNLIAGFVIIGIVLGIVFGYQSIKKTYNNKRN